MTLVLAAMALTATAIWICRRRPTWAVHHTRFGDVDQRWLIAIAIFVDAIYAVIGLQSWRGGGFLGLLALFGIQVALISGWLLFLFRRYVERRR